MHTVEALRHTGAGFVDADLAHKHPLEARRVSVALRTLAYLQKPFITRCNRHPGGKRVRDRELFKLQWLLWVDARGGVKIRTTARQLISRDSER